MLGIAPSQGSAVLPARVTVEDFATASGDLLHTHIVTMLQCLFVRFDHRGKNCCNDATIAQNFWYKVSGEVLPDIFVRCVFFLSFVAKPFFATVQHAGLRLG